MLLKKLCTIFVICLALVTSNLHAQTTGKVSGVVLDKETSEPMPGVNILIDGTHLGAATDIAGNFFILNVPPGTYSVSAKMIGYGIMTIKDIRVSVNSTTNVNYKLESVALQGEEIVVSAQAVTIKKDQTSSVRTVSTEDLKVLPVENLSQVVNLQAGVVQGHFRGGRDTEVTYLVDGLNVNNSFSGNYKSTEIDVEVVQELEVITGTFNAEYGRAMSGVVNAVTKEGAEKFAVSFSGSAANYFTGNSDIFIGLGKDDFITRNASQDYKIQLEGPVISKNLTFLLNYRFQNNNGYLNGIRLFNPLDYSDYSKTSPASWHTESTGDKKYVSMDTEQLHNVFGKLTFKANNNLKLGTIFSLNDRVNTYYDHRWKYNPDPLKNNFNKSIMGALTLNHLISPETFYDFKVSYNRQELKSYLYSDPLDQRYISSYYQGRGQTGFVTGGDTGPGLPTDTFTNLNAKFDIYWQANNNHALKAGFLATAHEIDRDRIDVRNIYEGTADELQQVVDPVTGKITFPYYELEVIPKTNETLDVYKVNPYELSAYLQDKMEFNSLVINLGLRFDYFNPDQVYPSNKRNPGNQLNLPDSMMSSYPKAPAKSQISPRFGLAYQLGDQAVLRFSYGHFFQMPPMYALYQNNVFRVPTNDYGITMGNSLLEAQKTVTYEIGLWQQLTEGMSLETALYYKDIYDLLSTSIISTYNQIEYGLFTNKDYGNARGLEVKWKYETPKFFTSLNYTLSYTKGNADNPWQTFNRAGDSRDPIKRYIPMSWDQRHTFNLTTGYTSSKYGIIVTGYFNSGTPYTYTPLGYSELSLINLYENNDIKPSSYSVDLTCYWQLPVLQSLNARLFMNIYNLIDALNTQWVYGNTGKPYETIVTDVEKSNFKSSFTDVYDQYQNPTCYSAPRLVKLGLQFQF